MKRLLFSLCVIATGVLVSGCADSSKQAEETVEALSSVGTESTVAESGTADSVGDAVSTEKAAESKPTEAIATLGNGCYWCTESVFLELKGIKSVVSGFSGGEDLDVTYEEVCTGRTGHAEVIQIKYAPNEISFAELLQAFFLTHDPTTLNRQGNDVGTQYRSVVFFHNEEQKKLAEEAIAALTNADVYADPIVTEVSPYKNFIAAPKYHQDFFNKNPNQPYCVFNIPSKVEKIRKELKHLVKKAE